MPQHRIKEWPTGCEAKILSVMVFDLQLRPSIPRTVAKACQMAERSISTYLHRMEGRGLLTKSEKPTGYGYLYTPTSIGETFGRLAGEFT